jgi:hypothetical protein
VSARVVDIVTKSRSKGFNQPSRGYNHGWVLVNAKATATMGRPAEHSSID